MPFIAEYNGRKILSVEFDEKQAWTDLRREASAGKVKLLCGCKAELSRKRWGHNNSRVTHFFRHPRNTGCQFVATTKTGSHGESKEHIMLKDLVAKIAKDNDLQCRFEVGGADWRADVLILNPKTGNEAVVEIQLSHETPEKVIDRTRARTRAGKKVIWFFRHESDLEALPQEFLKDHACFCLGQHSLDKMGDELERIFSIYLRGKMVFDDLSDLTRVPAELLTFSAHCDQCDAIYEAIHGVAIYPNRIRGSLVPKYLKIPRTFLPREALVFALKLHDLSPKAFCRLEPRVERQFFTKQITASCPVCEAPAPSSVKLRAADAIQKPQGHAFSLDYTELMNHLPDGFSAPEITWKERWPKGYAEKRMGEKEWARLMISLTREINLRADKIRAAREAKRRDEENKKTIAAERRMKSVKGYVTQIVSSIWDGERSNSFVGRWLDTKLETPFSNEAPAKIAMHGEGVYQAEYSWLQRKLKGLVDMMQPGGKSQDELLNLPIEEVREQRLQEQTEQEEMTRKERFRSREDKLINMASTVLASETLGREWVARPNVLLDHRAPCEVCHDGDMGGFIIETEGLKKCFTVLDTDYQKKRREEIQRDRELDRKEAIREAAFNFFIEKEKAKLWLKSPHPKLHKRSPIDCCSTDSELKAAMALLET